MSEKRDSLEGALSEASSDAMGWKNLMEHPQWEKFAQELRQEVALISQAVMRMPINSEYSAFSQEFFKGKFNGIEMALELPSTRYEEAETRRKALSIELEIEDESEAEVAAAGRGRIGANPFVTTAELDWDDRGV